MVKAWTPQFDDATVLQAKKKIIDALIAKLDNHGNAKVYNKEIYVHDKYFAQVLKFSGDELQATTGGLIERKFDLVGWHYLEVKNTTAAILRATSLERPVKSEQLDV